MKNLLHLGEDQYLTTLLLEHFSRLNLSEMLLRTLWHRTIGRFYYLSVDVGLTLRFTSWANSFSWSSFVVSVVSHTVYDAQVLVFILRDRSGI